MKASPTFRNGLLALSLSCFLFLTSCSEDDPTVRELLAREWLLEDVSGDAVFDPDASEVIFNFKTNEDFEIRLLPNGSDVGQFFLGDWDLASNDEDLEFEIEIGSDRLTFETEIDLITSEVLELDGSATDGSNTYDFTLEFEAVGQ